MRIAHPAMVVAVLVSLVAAALPARAAHAGEAVLCVPEAILARAAPADGGNARAQAAGLPFRVVLPLLVRAGDPPPPPPPPQGLVALAERLAAMIASAPVAGRFAVAVTDLQTGHTVGDGLDRVQLSGCVVNLFAIVAALRDVDAGRYPLADVDATIRQTIWASDATAAHQLFRTVGGGDAVEGVRIVNLLMRETLGMRSSLLDHPPAYPHESIGIDPANLITARDVNGALARIHAGEVLSAALTAYLVEAMTRVKPGLNYLTASLPAAAVVSHKNGFFWDAEGWVDNDTAIVRFGPALEHAYAITFLSEAVPGLYDDIPLGQRLVREAWDYFRAAYP